MHKKILIVGAGGMAQDYIKILKDLNLEFNVIGRSKESSEKCSLITGCKVISGGITSYLSNSNIKYTHAIVAVGIEALYSTTKELIKYGIKNILIEKPGALKFSEFEDLNNSIDSNNANVIVAYNRRFYASVLKAQQIIEKDGGVESFNFEFTEWAHKIEPLKKAEGVKEKWFLANSTHVVDLAFYLGGKPKRINSYTSGSLSWHQSASNFAGSGVSETNALFNYQANWTSAGRWSVELLTKENRLILRPMEKLQIQKRGTINQEFVEIDYSFDDKYKPGLFLQVKSFLNDDFSRMCKFKEQLEMLDTYYSISNYKKDD